MGNSQVSERRQQRREALRTRLEVDQTATALAETERAKADEYERARRDLDRHVAIGDSIGAGVASKKMARTHRERGALAQQVARVEGARGQLAGMETQRVVLDVAQLMGKQMVGMTEGLEDSGVSPADMVAAAAEQRRMLDLMDVAQETLEDDTEGGDDDALAAEFLRSAQESQALQTAQDMGAVGAGRPVEPDSEDEMLRRLAELRRN
jgi:hypothetical protein